MSGENFVKEYVTSQILNGTYTVVAKRKGKSPAWEAFGEIQKEDGTVVPNFVCCRQCQKLYSFSGRQTSNLLHHKCVKNLSQKAIISYIKLDQDAKQKSLEVCANWIINDCKSFISVEGSGFKNMVNFFINIGCKYGKDIDIDHLLPHSTTISRYINDMADKERVTIKTEIKDIVREGMAVTTDLWTDNYVRRTYLCATLHYIKDDQLCELVLGLKSMDFNSCTGININEKLKDILQEYDITDFKDIIFVTDRGSNMI